MASCIPVVHPLDANSTTLSPVSHESQKCVQTLPVSGEAKSPLFENF